ncbi:hypothetical protein EV191_101925 [Tamaricihabitans halophyticus]|uniref:DUF2637 domain-containing protein n=1 Tax=Tamaricihabitans halophyticus TaxID=1262583 RepID=A0A4R2RC25_9PSEU|nr:hypothetical protein [Tamaricihabitans halophyticus]TCP56975.1 hypothetical protein EV191_101925 [Tamaricihabitans halophyticus]
MNPDPTATAELSTAERLRREAAEATHLRHAAEHPDVIALRTEAVRRFVDRLMWIGILLGLGFTMVNVQTFAAEGAPAWSLAWLAAWLLDPMVSVVLIGVLRAEQVTGRWEVRTGGWVRLTKWFAFVATYVMNTWRSWEHGDAAGIVLHSVPPLLVLSASEAAPRLREALTEAVRRAGHHATDQPRTPAPPVTQPPASPPSTPGTDQADTTRPDHEPHQPDRAEDTTPLRANTKPSKPRTATRRPATRRAPAGGREQQLDTLRQAWQPGTEITPAWVREQLPDIGRTTSKTRATELRDLLEPTTGTTDIDRPAPVTDQGRHAA